MRTTALSLLIVFIQALPLLAALPIKVYIPPPKRQFVGPHSLPLTPRRPLTTQPQMIPNNKSVQPSSPPYIKAEQRVAEQRVINRNLDELRRILDELNSLRRSGGLTDGALQRVLTSASITGAKTESSDYRRWSYKSGNLMVKGKQGNFEYEQTFSLQGIAGAGAFLSIGMKIIACALDVKRLSECTKDSLSFIHELALPTESKK
jgi:hypothetical protein